MTIQQCRYVLEIVRLGSFNEAANSLFIAQASISSAIKELESELKIQIFKRTNKGIQITKEGAEFIRYARQIVSQVDVVKERYDNHFMFAKNFSVSTQHYDFVAEAFVSFMQYHTGNNYNFSLKETKTSEVIQDVKYLLSNLGILAFNKSSADRKFMERLFKKNNIAFHLLFETKPHVFIGSHHPLSKQAIIHQEDLIDYPYVTYEQGKEASVQFSEELAEIFRYNKSIKINDRATLMNLLIATDCYTIGTGIMMSELNNGNILSVPLNSNDVYAIGWIIRNDIALSEEGKLFIQILTELTAKIQG